MKPSQLSFLESSLASGRLSHAYVFSGFQRALKEEVMAEFLLTLVSDGCFQCVTCRQVSSFQHPDVTLVEPAVSDGALKIGIDQVRELKRLLGFASYGGGYKVGILRRADLMNTDAQSSLLKLLEEPSGKTLLILLADHAELLLPTIRSRTQEVSFRGGKEEAFPFVPEGSLRAKFLKAKEIADGDGKTQEEAVRALAAASRVRLRESKDVAKAFSLALLTMRAEEAFARSKGSFRLALEQAYMEL